MYNFNRDSNSDTTTLATKAEKGGAMFSLSFLDRLDRLSEVAKAYVRKGEGGFSLAGFLVYLVIRISAICCKKNKNQRRQDEMDRGGASGSLCTYLCVCCIHLCMSALCNGGGGEGRGVYL